MPVVFGQNTGEVIAIQDSVASGALQLGNVTGGARGRITYQNMNTIITRVGVSSAGNYQFLHTIGNDVYVYVFGDRMGDITLHGLCFSRSCTGSTATGVQGLGGTVAAFPGSPTSKHGFEMLYRWYELSRIAVNPNLVEVTIGLRTVFKGFITGLTADVNDSASRTIQFQLTLSLLPDAT